MNRPVVETLPDAGARRRIRTDLDSTLFVEAAAGTGKTTELLARIVALVRSGRTSLDRIVAVTFTEKAAGEMKLRLRAEIETARASERGQARRRLDESLGHLELSRIGTIHAFCADLLRERPVEAGVDLLFEVAAEDVSRRLLDTVFDDWFQRTLANPPAGVRRILRRRARGPRAQTPREALQSAAAALVEHRDFPTPWRRDTFARAAAIDSIVARLEEIGGLAARAEWAGDYLARNLDEIHRFAVENTLREEVRGRDYDGLEAALRELARSRTWRWRGSPRYPYAAGLPREEVIARRDAVRAELDEFLRQADADLAPLLRAELRPVIEAYEELKQRLGKLDFLDLLVRARDLLRDDRAVRAEVQARFTHYFVDEFQDTDPLQAEMLLLLAAADPAQSDWRRVSPVAGKLFLVGDPKQSIYRFRRADVAVYEEVKRLLTRGGAECVYLKTSFRGVPAIQAAVNAAFAPSMKGSDGDSQAGYVALECFRPALEGQPAVVALPVPRPYGDYGTITQWAIEQSFPDAVGAFVDWLVQRSGWTVAERGRPQARVPVQPRHVCILFRRFRRYRDDVTRGYVRALEVRQIPHVLVGGRSFHDREEVLAIRNALYAIEWPDDELRVFATLRGPLFALGDDALLAFRQHVGKLHPLRRLDPGALDDADREVAEALAVLGRRHAGRNRRPIAATIGQLLEAVRAHAGIAIWPTGEQALANCLRVLDLARRFERGGAASFRAFVEQLEEEAERGAAQEAPAVEEGTEGVRVMTVHRAKGLEFPIVILADPTCSAVRDVPTRHLDGARALWVEPLCGCAPPELLEAREEERRRDRDEAVRLAYVAATRARDLLVVPVVGDRNGEADGGWLDVLSPAIYPATSTRRHPEPAPGCPAGGDDSVLERPPRAGRQARDSVAPGLHCPGAGSHAVAWWDPRALGLGREQVVGLRQQSILEADEREVAVDEGVRAHERWQRKRRESLAAGATETIRARAVTALAHAADAAPAPAGAVEVFETQVDRARRPHGVRFGTLVHAALAAVALDAGAGAVRAAARLQGRFVGATDEEVEAAVAAVRAALRHPLLHRAGAAAELRRETPMLLRLEDGSLAEGVVDLAFREEGDGWWTVVDFKTDVEIAARRAEYEAQVRLYAAAVAAATGRSARGVLLAV